MLKTRTPPAACPLALALLLVLGGCQESVRGVRIWVAQSAGAGSLTRSSRGGAIAALEFGSGQARVRLHGAINETLDFRIAVRVSGEPVERPSFRVTVPRSSPSSIDASAVRLYRMLPVTVGRFPGWHVRSIPPDQRVAQPLDVLVPVDAPLGGLPTTLLADRTYDFWVDVAIPKGTRDGPHTARISLMSDGAVVASLLVDLTVWPIVLPDEGDIPVIAELDDAALIDHCRPVDRQGDLEGNPRPSHELNAVVLDALRLLQSHGLTPVLHKLSPLARIDARGRVAVDWGRYDAIVEPCLNGRAFSDRVPLRFWPIPVHNLVKIRPATDEQATTQRSEFIHQYLRECAHHFADKGWIDRSYVLPGDASVSGAVAAAAVRRFAEVAHGADERLAIASRLWPQDMAPLGWTGYSQPDLSGAVDIWLPPAQFHDPDEMARQRAAGRRTWLAVDRPPFSGSIAVSAPRTHLRVLTWQGWRLGVEALYLGCVNRWPSSREPSAPDDCLRADPQTLLYPGRRWGLDGPVPSVRLKHLRRSVQDAAYRSLLKEHGLEHVVITLGESLAYAVGADTYRTHFADGKPGAWPHDPLVFDLARDIMAEELVRIVRGQRSGGRREALPRTAVWRRFRQATRNLALRVDGTRVRLTGSRTTWEALAEVALTVDNRSLVAVAGEARFASLPEGWTRDDAGAMDLALPPLRSRRVTLSARATALPETGNGLWPVPVEFGAGGDVAARCTARVALVTAVPSTGRIRVDGDLSDWPVGGTNVAGDFQLIAGGWPDGAHEPSRRPHNPTFALVMRDAEYLYVAINSELDDNASRAWSSRNRIDYDDLVPVADELVEVLLDPLNSGTRSPGDLYHIAIKPSGAYLTERGIRFDPPCGTYGPWPVEIEIGTTILSDRWIAELRIPLAAFDIAATEHTIWGFGLTRYDALRQEFSTWAGATGNAYDPLSLGNLYLP